MSGKKDYLLVDILDYYPFDTSVAGGNRLIITINDEPATFMSPVAEGDIVRIYWAD